MGMMYSAVFSAVAVTAVQDFFEITSPSDCIVVIHSVEIAQSSDVGDAQAEGLPILHKRGSGSVTGGSGGSTPTPAPLEFGFAAAGSTTKTNNTTRMVVGTGAIATLYSSNWIIQQPYLYLPTPEMRPVLSPSQKFTVELNAAPADSITVSGSIVFEEIGG